MRKKPLPLLEKVTIVDAGAEGKAIARVDDLVVFVPFVVPGDVVDIQVIHRKRNFMEGKVTAFHSYSPDRIEPFCNHFGICGGCKWQNMPYQEQLKYKQKQVVDNFSRIGRFEFPEVMPILASEHTRFYRNKLEYTFTDRRWLTDGDMKMDPEARQMKGLGFHLPQLFDRILDIDYCYLQPEPSNRIRLALKEFALEKKFIFYNARSHKGFLRNIVIRNTTMGGLMVIVVFGLPEFDDEMKCVLDFLAEKFPEITSLMYVLNTKKNDVITDLEVFPYKGDPFLVEEMPDPHGGSNLKFKIGPVSFYQTNPVQAFHLYITAYDFAGFNGSELVYDLYCGTGTISNFIAKSVKKVVGIEYVPSAIDDARENSVFNGIDNTSFYAGDLAKMLNDEFVAANGKPDVVITDPPRSGMHPKVIDQLLAIEAPRIVYVSCNPATQARDIVLLNEKYKVEAVQPVDMFPHTHHVENVTLLRIRE
ncbi:MAG TPA: 23S rRNA (uracil(1939)-C(5))-methyltransferase RlmD [Bacteroidales bacterium]|nr:23S rRNA (uracil(1939)-C(5))-methyltransferase RlmD [Bacteroidales bacterium]